MASKECRIPELDKLFPTGRERLQKLLARAGLGSRRKCEEMIREGRVKIDGKAVRELGSRANPESQTVLVDEKPIITESYVYYLLNKPKNVLCTADDLQNRRTVLSFFPEETRRIFPVGRLDFDSKGAVILTNDGRLTQIISHPRYGLERTYHVRVRGHVDDYTLNRLRSGIQLSEGRTSPAKAWITKRRDDETELGITIREGWNRQVRRMFAAVSHKVRSLTRIQIGPVSTKGLANGEARSLTRQEVREFAKLALHNESAPPPWRRRSGPRPKRQGKPNPRFAWQQYQKRLALREHWTSQTKKAFGKFPEERQATETPHTERFPKRRGQDRSQRNGGSKNDGGERNSQERSTGRRSRKNDSNSPGRPKNKNSNRPRGSPRSR